jgi:FAD/FMN-containing dehydrogenase
MLAGSALVVGFDPITSSWITSEAATGAAFDRLPPLDGRLRLDDEALAAASEDFGRFVHERPVAVLEPGSSRDIARVVRFAQRNGLRVAVRGSGHSLFGQTQVRGGLVIDMSTLATVHDVTDDRVSADAGCRWGAVLAATLAQERTPPVLPDFLGLSVGGTLSIGGISPTTFRHGAQVDNVLELEVVTGEGRIRICSPAHHRDLFEGTLAGQGQCAIITRAVLRLVRAPARVRVFELVYPALDTLLDDAARLAIDGRFDGVVAWVFRGANGVLQHVLIATRYFTPPDRPDDASLLSGLRHLSAASRISDLGYLEYSDRVPDEFPPLPHPAICLCVPGSSATAYIQDALARLNPDDLGDFDLVQIFSWRRSRFTRPLFRVPDEESVVGFAVLRYAPDEGTAARMLAGNRVLYDDNRRLGGTLYPFTAAHLSRRDWRLHYGRQWDDLVAAKARYDSYGVLASGPDL